MFKRLDTGLDSTKQVVKLLSIQHKQSSWVQNSHTGGQLYSRTIRDKVSE